MAAFWALACCHELWERPGQNTGLHLEMGRSQGVIGDRWSRVSRLYCTPPAAHWDPGLLPVPGKWGESRPTWEEWETLVSADNLEKLKKPTRGKDCSPPLPPSHCPGGYDLLALHVM